MPTTQTLYKLTDAQVKSMRERARVVEGTPARRKIAGILAAEAGVHKINFVISVSKSHNLANVRRTPQESIEVLREIAVMVRSMPLDNRPEIDVGMSTAFGCSMEGRVEPEAVFALAQDIQAAGIDGMTVADTVGYADPASVRHICAEMLRRFPQTPIAVHLHDTRGLALANALSAYREGVTIFDGSLGGLGGCPHAPGATGNVAFEDLVFMFEMMGVSTGVDLAKLLAVRVALSASVPANALGGNLIRAGIPKNYAHAA